MKRFKIFLTLIICGFIFTGIYAQTNNPDDPIPPDPAIRIGKLDNGLTYYIKYNQKPE